MMKPRILWAILLASILVTLMAETSAPAQGFTPNGSMSIPRTRHTATLLPDGRVLVAGGQSNSSNYLASAEIYNPATGLWSLTTPMSYARSEHTATLLPNGKVLIVGGRTNASFTFGSHAGVSSVELFDPLTETWVSKGSLPISGRAGHTATLLPDGKILVAGGNGDFTSIIIGNTRTCLIYDSGADSWTTTDNMANSRRLHTSTLLPNGTVIVTGNSSLSPFSGTYNYEIYNPNTGAWKTNLHNQMFFANASGLLSIGSSETLLFNSKVLIAGGQITGNSDPGNSSYLYDYSNDTWAKNASMSTARNCHTATLLPDGRVLVAGGFGTNSVYRSSAEIYDPTNATWSSVSPMSAVRGHATATLLKNGQVLIVGGESNTSLTSTATAELFDTIARVQTPIVLQNPGRQTNGAFQFNYLGNPNGTNYVFATTNLTMPTTNWTALGVVGEIQPGLYWFTDSQSTNYPYRFYQVR